MSQNIVLCQGSDRLLPDLCVDQTQLLPKDCLPTDCAVCTDHSQATPSQALVVFSGMTEHHECRNQVGHGVQWEWNFALNTGFFLPRVDSPTGGCLWRVKAGEMVEKNYTGATCDGAFSETTFSVYVMAWLGANLSTIISKILCSFADSPTQQADIFTMSATTIATCFTPYGQANGRVAPGWCDSGFPVCGGQGSVQWLA